MQPTRIARYAGTLTALGFVLVFFLLAAALLSGCAAQHQLTPQRPPRPDVISLLTPGAKAASTTPYEAAPGSIAPPTGFDARGKVRIKAERKQARVQKGLLRKWREQFKRDAKLTKTGPAASVPRKCKGCTIVYGDATVAGKKAQVATEGADLTNIEKAKAPVATDGATSKDQRGAGVASDITGDNNAPQLTNTAPQAPGIGATIAAKLTGPVGIVLGVAAAGGLVYLLLLWRKKSLV
jgi:hypothetical protein